MSTLIAWLKSVPSFPVAVFLIREDGRWHVRSLSTLAPPLPPPEPTVPKWRPLLGSQSVDRVETLPEISATDLEDLRTRSRDVRNELVRGTRWGGDIGRTRDDIESDPLFAIVRYKGSGYTDMLQVIREELVPSSTNFRATDVGGGFVVDMTREQAKSSQQDIVKWRKEERARDKTTLDNAKLSLALNSYILATARLMQYDRPLIVYRGISETSFLRIKGYTTKQWASGRVDQLPNYERHTGKMFEHLFQRGSTVPFFGFVSTTLSVSYGISIRARGINHWHEYWNSQSREDLVNECCFLQFVIPPGYPFIYLGSMEFEVLLPFSLTSPEITLPEWRVKSVKVISYVFTPCHPGDDSRECRENALRAGTSSRVKIKVITLEPATQSRMALW